MAKQKNPRRVKVETALADLEFSHKRISGDVKKVLNSAIANAENNHGLDVDSLIVSEAYVGKNFVMKRFRARARGRGWVRRLIQSACVLVLTGLGHHVGTPTQLNMAICFIKI